MTNAAATVYRHEQFSFIFLALCLFTLGFYSIMTMAITLKCTMCTRFHSPSFDEQSDFKHAIFGNASLHYRHAGENDITRECSR